MKMRCLCTAQQVHVHTQVMGSTRDARPVPPRVCEAVKSRDLLVSMGGELLLASNVRDSTQQSCSEALRPVPWLIEY